MTYLFVGVVSMSPDLTCCFGLFSRLWGTFLADVVIQMLGTDYARVLRAIYAFAEVSFIFHTNSKICVLKNKKT